MLRPPHLGVIACRIFCCSLFELQILVDDKEKSIIGAYHVSDGIGCCWVGLLKSEVTRFIDLYEGVLAQIISMHTGSSDSVIISWLPEEMIVQITINSI